MKTSLTIVMSSLAVWISAIQAATVASDQAQKDQPSAELISIAGNVERAVSIVRFQKAASEAGLSSGGMLVGVATSMEKILPRQAPVDVAATKQVELSLAPNEKESVQIAVLSTKGPLRKVAGQRWRSEGVRGHGLQAREHRLRRCGLC